MNQSERSPSMQLVQEVATYTGVDPLELPPLYDAIDPVALDTCVSALTGIDVSFEYAGIPITVESTGDLQIGEEPSTVNLWNATETDVRATD